MKPGRSSLLITVLALLLGAVPEPSAGQSLRLGVTWAVPSDPAQAARDLREIHAAGFLAVRIGNPGTAEIYALADSLGLALYQDLPIRALPAGPLLDTLGHARVLLADVLAVAGRYRSVHGVGLADLADTSNPDACEYFADLTRLVRRSDTSRVATYYATRFTTADQCEADVDEVLYALLDEDVAALERFLNDLDHSGRTVGVSSVGTWTDLELDLRGLNHPRSPESQARQLEHALRSLRTAADRLKVVFVHRWRDPASIDDVYADMVQRRYGLHNSSGGRRPVFDVAAGFATGEQDVFAFDLGTDPARGWMWMTILGWGVLAALGIAYATSPRMRHMVPRYFLSHGFFREAVISGRESLVGESIALLGAVSVGVGMLTAILTLEISFLPLFEVGRIWLTPAVRDFAGALLDQPWTLTLLVASAYALIAVGWTSVLSLLSRTRHTLLPAQAMMLVIWPQWTLMPLLLVAPAVAAAGGGGRLEIAEAASAVALLLLVLAAGRTLLDFWRCSRVSPGILLAGVVLHPAAIGLVAALIFAARHAGATGFLWHLLTRT